MATQVFAGKAITTHADGTVSEQSITVTRTWSDDGRCESTCYEPSVLLANGDSVTITWTEPER